MRLHEQHVWLRRDRLDLIEIDVQPEIAGRRLHHFTADAVELRQQIGGHVRLDVHDHVAVGRVREVHLERLDAGGHGQPLLHPSRIEELRIDLPLGRRPGFLLPEQRLDLRPPLRRDAVASGC